MALLTPPQYLDSLRRSINELIQISTGNLDVDVSDCPGWKVADLMKHVGQVFAMVDAIVIPRSQQRVGPGAESQPADGQDVLEWFTHRSQSVVRSLENIDASESLWTWSDRQHAGDLGTDVGHGGGQLADTRIQPRRHGLRLAGAGGEPALHAASTAALPSFRNAMDG